MLRFSFYLNKFCYEKEALIAISCYRFFRASEKACCKRRYKIPTPEETNFLAQGYNVLENNFIYGAEFKYSQQNIFGRYSIRKIWMSNWLWSPCMYLSFLWSNNISDSVNLVPRFNSEEWITIQFWRAKLQALFETTKVFVQKKNALYFCKYQFFTLIFLKLLKRRDVRKVIALRIAVPVKLLIHIVYG